MKSYQQSFLINHFGKTVEELWTDFVKTLDKLSEECIPSKIIRGKSSLPWITQEIKGLIRKRDSFYTKFKKSGDQDTKTKFQTLRQQIKKKIKDSYQGYLENLLGLNDSDNTCDSKKIFSFLKNSRRDQQGIPPLKHNNILHSDTKTKADIFNQQFNSVFTPKEPLSLSRLAKMRVQDLSNAGGLPSDTIPDRQQDSETNMPEIDISLNGLLKLLHNLKPGKAAGPDMLKPLLLRELRDEIAPIIKVIFDRSLQTGKLPADWTKANVMPVFKKGDKSLAANYRPISLTCILCKVL